MARIVVELTNRCNLSCQHCFSGRHGGKDDLPLEVLDRVLAEAKSLGFHHLSFTGGDPTVHPQFAEVLRRTCEAEYRFGMVTNGWNFTTIYPLLLARTEWLSGITFSLDGATEVTHDVIRSRGSFRRVLQAMSICVFKELPFTINMVVTAHNRHEIALMAGLATKLRSGHLRFGHLMPTPTTTALGWDLSPQERRDVEREIADLASQSELPISMGPGYHSPELFPCAPLQMQEVNVDCRGYLTKCCHLSSHGEGHGQQDVFGDLADTTFKQAFKKLVADNDRFRADKQAHASSGEFSETDHFACWYCSLYYRKVDWLREITSHDWTPGSWQRPPQGAGSTSGE